MLTSAPVVTEEGKQWKLELQHLPTAVAQARYIERMRTARTDDLTKDDFRDRIILALDVAKIPPSTLAMSTGIAKSYLERYIIGSECVQIVRTIACKSIAAIDPTWIPQFLPEEKSLRSLDKMAQAMQSERDLLLRSHFEQSSFDWSNDRVFSKLVAFAIDAQQYSEQALAKEMCLSASFVGAWRAARTLPLPITRRRFMDILHVATYAPLPRE